MAVIPYRIARARAATNMECGARVAQAMTQESTHLPVHRMAAIVERGTFGDPGDSNPPPASRRPVRPLGARPWSSSSTSPAPAQLDLSGQPIPVPPPPAVPPPSRGQQLALPATVARSYRSQAWGGTVTEAPLPLSEEV